ncbi:glycoside hydrolase family 105 protein [Pyrrhoderma noxium]|uniref:Glycoside hydrolase family 105 protein n=1 Tax=Pyrrhoderma noxium TaxID=2282107 RepID=A0A286UJ07_9AGAM|nr:glycoside hydrolase family 105 protein [Pyrrhoderma noxium]
MSSEQPVTIANVADKSKTLSSIRKLIHCLVNITDDSGEFLMTLADGRVIDTKGWNDWEWTHGVGLYGLLKFHQITLDESALQIILEWYKNRFEAGTTKNVNTMSPLLTAAYMHEAKKADYLVHLESWAEWVMHDMPRTEEGGLQHATYLTENKGQLWDDTLMMSVLPLAKIGLVLDRREYVEEAKRQFMLHVKYLADLETGLWFHGWTFEGRHHFARARWARGNCWITISIPDFLELLSPSTSPDPSSPDYGIRLFLISTLRAQVDALIPLQDSSSGLWHTLLDDPTSYLEASASAGFAYGILKALRLRLLPREDPKYIGSALRAIKGVIDNINEKGELERVSFGTPVFDSLDEYKQVKLTSMPYGQSCALLALTEYLRLFI